jgi:hypothetical protein
MCVHPMSHSDNVTQADALALLCVCCCCAVQLCVSCRTWTVLRQGMTCYCKVPCWGFICNWLVRGSLFRFRSECIGKMLLFGLQTT